VTEKKRRIFLAPTQLHQSSFFGQLRCPPALMTLGGYSKIFLRIFLNQGCPVSYPEGDIDVWRQLSADNVPLSKFLSP